MAANYTAGIVTERKVDSVLDVEIDDTKNSMRRQQGGDGVDDGVVIRLHKRINT